MKQIKRLLSMLLSLCMVLGMIPPTAFATGSALPFTDVKATDWFYDEVLYVYENELMNGTSNTKFSPDTTTTRGMIVTILHRMEGTPSANGETFDDVSSRKYYADAVAWASANGIVGGYGDGRFGPDDPITREQMATILYRYTQHKDYNTTAVGDVSAFVDGNDTSTYAVAAMNWAVGAGLISGVQENVLDPSGSATRAQVAAILMRFCNTIIPAVHTVTFDYNYGNKGTYATVEVKDGETVKKPDSPNRYGYYFAGWCATQDGDVSFNFNTPITEDITLYAKWVEIVIYEPEVFYTVSFNMNGHGDAIESQTVIEGGKVIKPADPIAEGFTFSGWFVDANCTTEYNFNAVVTANMILYAKWTENVVDPEPETYTVSFDMNGHGTAIESQTVIEGGKVTKPIDPVAEGFTFGGWFVDEECTTEYDFDAFVTASLILYAKWVAIEIGTENYRVTFDRNDGTAGVYHAQWVNAGGTVSEPVEPTRELYRFTGWYMESAAITKYDFSTPVTSDLTLYAGWGNPDGSEDDLYAASDETETIFSITDVFVDGNNVTITYNTNDTALIVVEFFPDQMEIGEWSEENLNNNLNLAPITVASGYTETYGELATITLSITDELPDYYLVRAKMYDSDSNFAEYISTHYTETYALFDALTVDDFDEDRVINFDGDSTTNFGVIKDDVIVVPIMCQYGNGSEFRVDDVDAYEAYSVYDVDDDTDIIEPELDELVPDHLFTFPDKNAVISTNSDGTTYTLNDLEVGDVIYIEGTTWMFKIKTIEVNEDGSISFTQDKDVTMLDFYDTLKVDFEGVEAEVSDPRLRWEVIDIDAKGSVTIGPFSLANEFDNGVELSGSISGKVTGSVELSYDAHLFSADYFEASFSFTTEITGEVKAEVSTGSNTDDNHEWKNVVFQVDTRKVKLPTPVTGLEIYIKPAAQIDWSLSGEVSINWTSKQTSGFKYNSDTGRTDIKKKETTVSVMAKGKAEAKIGPIIDIGVEVLGGVLSGGVVAEAGAKLTAEAEIGADDLLNNADSKHACGLCVSGRADWYASAYVKCSYKITNSLKGDIVKLQILDISAPITFNVIPGRFFVSVINSSDSPFGGHVKFGGGDCTNKTYRTEIKVQDNGGHDIDGIQVSVVRHGKTSGKSGVTPYVVYLYDGTYNASATIDGIDVSKTVAVSGSRQTVILSKTAVDTILEGTVVDANDSSMALSGVSVKISKGDVVVASTETDSNGRFSVAVPSGSLTVELSRDGYLPFSSTETVHEGDATHSMGQVELTVGSGMGGFHGVIRDAVTNEPLADVTLNLYEGWNNPAESNTALRTLETDSNGEFRYDTITLFGNIIGLPSGNYTLTASKEGYSDISYNIVIYPGTTDENPAITETMSPEMSEGFYRIVLTWGIDPRDLDSHLVADTTSGGGIHVYYSDKNPSPYYANLDVDDTDSEGPETITITNFEGLSNIRYAVHDYTNRGEEFSDSLSNSGAVVRIYKGNQLLRTFNVPAGYDGTVWEVFSLNADGTIVSINTMTYQSNPEGVLRGSEAGTWTASNPLKDYELAEIAAGNEMGDLEPEIPSVAPNAQISVITMPIKKYELTAFVDSYFSKIAA